MISAPALLSDDLTHFIIVVRYLTVIFQVVWDLIIFIAFIRCVVKVGQIIIIIP